MATEFFERTSYGWLLWNARNTIPLTNEFASVFARRVLGLAESVESAPLAHDAIAAMEGG